MYDLTSLGASEDWSDQIVIQQNTGTSVVIEGRTFLYFGGTNYLGLAHRSELFSAAAEAFHVYGFSAGASRLTSGESSHLIDLELQLASFARSDSALVLPSGYVSNLAVVDALDDLVDVWVVQPHAHRSILSAIKQSRKKIVVLDQGRSPRDFDGCGADVRIAVFMEPIEPLTGSISDVGRVADELRSNDFLVLDEAHSFGVLGTGKGAIEHFRLSDAPNLIRTGTFSKALGTQGGFVLGSGHVIALIIEKSGTYRASTPLSPVLVAATTESLRILSEEPDQTIDRLRENIRIMNAHLATLAPERSTEVPIYYLCGIDGLADLQVAFRTGGLFVPQVGSYFAGLGDIGLRFTIQANHSREQLDLLASVMNRHFAKAPSFKS